MRDMLFHVTACSNQPPTADSGVFNSVTGSAIISGPRQLEICGTEPFCGSLSVVDPNTEQQVFISSNIATALPGATLQMSGTNPVELQLCWTNPIIGSHSFTITATDDACPFSGTRVHAYTINVGVAPYAGENASLSVCENASPFNMIDSLGGVPAPGGQWLDPDGQLSNGIFSPGSSVAGLHTYTVGFEECTSTAVLSVVLQSSEAPECLNVGIPLNRWINLQLVPDPVINSRFLLTGTTMDALISVLSSDGRLITTQRMQLHRDAPAVIEIPRHHHGLAIVRVQGLANGAHFASRVMVP